MAIRREPIAVFVLRLPKAGAEVDVFAPVGFKRTFLDVDPDSSGRPGKIGESKPVE